MRPIASFSAGDAETQRRSEMYPHFAGTPFALAGTYPDRRDRQSIVIYDAMTNIRACVLVGRRVGR